MIRTGSFAVTTITGQVLDMRSRERLEDSWNCLLRLFRSVSASQVRGSDILRYANLHLREGAAPATVNRELAALRAA